MVHEATEIDMERNNAHPFAFVQRIAIWLRCKRGLHTWGEVEAQPIEVMPPHILFFSWGEQDGKRTCTKCGHTQQVHRAGWVGMGCEEIAWKKAK